MIKKWLSYREHKLLGRPLAEISEQATAEVWQAVPIIEEQRCNLIGLIPPSLRPRVVLR